jgi:hypothetical protein
MRNICVLLTAAVVGLVSLGFWTLEPAAGQSKAPTAPPKNARPPAKAKAERPPAKVKEVHREEKHKEAHRPEKGKEAHRIEKDKEAHHVEKGKAAPVPRIGNPRTQDELTKHRKQMEHALRLLHEARKKAASVPYDHFGDHRRQAVDSMDRAIRQMNDALKWEREHRH